MLHDMYTSSHGLAVEMLSDTQILRVALHVLRKSEDVLISRQRRDAEDSSSFRC